jgi:hypothetical protein
MKQPLEVALTYEVEVELPDEFGSGEAVTHLRTRTDLGPFPLVLDTVERPTKVHFQTVVIRPTVEPRPDEFRCDSCRREFSNDEKNVNDSGDELCDNCRCKEQFKNTFQDPTPGEP